MSTRPILILLFVLVSWINGFSQDNNLKLLLLPHPRSEDKLKLSVQPAIEKIDFSKYDVLMLGGDLDWYTSSNRTSMDYCDALFKLSDPNTLWCLGNHDLDNPAMIKEYTGKERFYAYYRDSITFIVLDTELDANGFISSFISGQQLSFVQSVCDTIEVSHLLIVLHHRLLWMIGNPDFTTRIDSVGESTRQLETTNFYEDIFPLLKKVKAKGIPVLCLGGDKSKINIEYSPEDSIYFYTSIMAPEFSENENYVLQFNYEKLSHTLTRSFIPLSDVPKKAEVSANPFVKSENLSISIRNDRLSDCIWIRADMKPGQKAIINIYSLSGVLYKSFYLQAGEEFKLDMECKGFFILMANVGSVRVVKKFATW